MRRTHCRWCRRAFTKWTLPEWARLGFCSRACCMDRYDEDGRND